MIKQELDRIKERISNKDFLENKGLSNEVGIHVFCYKAEDVLIQRIIGCWILRSSVKNIAPTLSLRA